MVTKLKLMVGILILLIFIMTFVSQAKSAQTLISLNPMVKYQTMIGWEATAQAGQIGCDTSDFIQGNPVMCPAFKNIRNVLFDALVNDLGVNRLRIELYPGIENPTDYFLQHLSGQISEYDWVHVYGEQIINDNNDPNAINFAGFHFSFLDHQIDTVVLPIKQRLEARGEMLFFNACYVDFNQNNSDYHHYNYPQEYAEFVLATYQHMQSKYGFVPNSWEIELEPDNTNFDGTKMGQAIQATAALLEAHGFTPRFVVPSTTNMDNALPYFNAIKSVIGEASVSRYVMELSYHRYAGGSSLKSIGDTALSYGIGGAMLEWIGASYTELHADITSGNNSSWAQYTIANPYYWASDDGGGAYYLVDDSNPDAPTLIMGSRTEFLRQYFKFVRRGAVRIDATSDNYGYNPLAFINTDNKFVVIVKADKEGDIGIQGLPVGFYGIKYTTNSQYDFDLPDQYIQNGQNLYTSIPEHGVITIYGKSNSIPTPSPTVDPTQTQRGYLPLIARDRLNNLLNLTISNEKVSITECQAPTH